MRASMSRSLCEPQRFGLHSSPARSLTGRAVRPPLPLAAGIIPSGISKALGDLDDSLQRILWRWELAAFALLIGLFNLPLLTGSFSTQFIFHPAAASAGEWWRLFTHPFVHVSWYHLVLDALAFFLAYTELQHRRFRERLAFVAAAGAGSVLTALVASPLIASHGLCGLSGVAHGLAAVVSLEMLRRSNDKVSRWSGLLCFLGVAGKSLVELVTGNVLFASWHLGWLGTPIAACHAGGVLGAMLVWLLLQRHTTSNDAGLD
jgi:rhomboid family GlyGly-CTERM serine protease